MTVRVRVRVLELFDFLSPTLHNEAPTQLLHLTNIFTHSTKTRSFTLQYSNTLYLHYLKTKSPLLNLISSLPFGTISLVFTHLRPLPPLFFLFRTRLLHFFNPYPRFLHFYQSFFFPQHVSQAGRVVFLALAVISFRSFQTAGRQPAAAEEQALIFFKCVSVCVPTASPRRGASLVCSKWYSLVNCLRFYYFSCS